MWLIRSVLEVARAGQPASASSAGTACVSRAHAFSLQDTDSGSYNLHSTSGLVTSSGFGSRRKASYFYYSAFKTWLGNYTYAGPADLPSGTSSSVRALCFVSRSSGAYSIVVWATTSSASVFPGVAVSLSSASCPVVPAGVSGASALLVTPSNGVLGGSVTSISGSSATLSVSEVPVIVTSKA